MNDEQDGRFTLSAKTADEDHHFNISKTYPLAVLNLLKVIYAGESWSNQFRIPDEPTENEARRRPCELWSSHRKSAIPQMRALKRTKNV